MIDDYQPQRSLLDGDFSCETTEEFGCDRRLIKPCWKCPMEMICERDKYIKKCIYENRN